MQKRNGSNILFLYLKQNWDKDIKDRPFRVWPFQSSMTEWKQGSTIYNIWFRYTSSGKENTFTAVNLVIGKLYDYWYVLHYNQAIQLWSDMSFKNTPKCWIYFICNFSNWRAFKLALTHSVIKKRQMKLEES